MTFHTIPLFSSDIDKRINERVLTTRPMRECARVCRPRKPRHPHRTDKSVPLCVLQPEQKEIEEQLAGCSIMRMNEHLHCTFEKKAQLNDKLDDRTVFVLPAWEIAKQ